jgi:hypothetical protein
LLVFLNPIRLVHSIHPNIRVGELSDDNHKLFIHPDRLCGSNSTPWSFPPQLPVGSTNRIKRAMDPSTAGGGQQQQRGQQPVYDVRQGGHYGTSSINLFYQLHGRHISQLANR